MKLSEIDYSNNFNDLDIDLKKYINTDNHVVFLDSNLSSILNLDENLNIFEIDIYDMSGRLISRYSPNQSPFIIDINDLQNGQYIIIGKSNKGCLGWRSRRGLCSVRF